jgi:hypothetical protein
MQMMEDGDDLHLTHEGVFAAAKAVDVEQWNVPTDFADVARLELAQLFSRHHLHGACIAATEPILLFRLSDSTRVEEIKNSDVRVVPWGWPGRFGASLTMTCHFIGANAPCRVLIVDDECDKLDKLSKGLVKAAFFRGRRMVAAFRFDFTNSDEALQNLRAHIRAVQTSEPTTFRDDSAHYWEVTECMTSLASEWTATDKLQLGWYKTFEEDANVLRGWLADFQERKPLPSTEGLSVPGAFQQFVDLVLSPQTDARVLLDHIHEKFGSVPGELANFLGDRVCISRFFGKNKDWEELFYFVGTVIATYNSSSLASDCGRQLPWYDFTSHDFKKLRLVPQDFPLACSPEEFWRRIPKDGVNYGWGLALSGSDVLLDKNVLLKCIDTMPQADDPIAVDASANALFEEAVANKRGTIPRGAHVQLAFGPFAHIEVSEFDPIVLFTCRTDDNQILRIDCEPTKNFCSFSLPTSDVISEDRSIRIDAGIKLLLAAIIRDFWVVENREAVFDTQIARQRGTTSGQANDNGAPRIVYIPRVHYSPKSDSERCAAALDHAERRAHFVQGHVRRSNTASKYQIDLAIRYGISVPTGYTFVRPHERGKTKRDVIYRSRSALQSLYTAFVEGPTTPSRWFQFERDVHKLMDSLGFTVEHIASAKRGDNGVDVFATKGTGLEEVQWIIQCKCWKAARKIYPSTVRELIGVLSGYPRGVRGMIVTTSSFSSGARQAADAADIRLMDGSEFATLTDGS